MDLLVYVRLKTFKGKYKTYNMIHYDHQEIYLFLKQTFLLSTMIIKKIYISWKSTIMDSFTRVFFFL